MYRFTLASLVLLLSSILVAGCSKSRGDAPSGLFASEHFSTLKGGGGHATDQLNNGIRVGDGLVFWHLPTSMNGTNAVVRVTVFLGPFGTDDNTPRLGDQPHLFPNYVDGAENYRPASHYEPIALNRVGGSDHIWECTITNFPMTGRFVYTLARNRQGSVVSYVGSLHRDSSFDGSRESLQATYDWAAMAIRTPGHP